MNEFLNKIREEIKKYRFSEPQKAYDCCCKLLEHSAEYEDMYEEAYARLYMGDTLFTLGKLSEALDMLFLAEKLQKQYGYEDLLMKNYNIMAIIYVTQGDELLALDYYYQSMGLARKKKDYNQIAVVHNNIGALLYNLGEEAEAAQYFETAWKLSQRDGTQKPSSDDIRQIVVNISHKYFVAEKYQEAKKFLDRNLPPFCPDEACVPTTAVCVIGMYIHLEYHLGHDQTVLELYEQLQCHFGELTSKLEVLIDLIGIANVLIKMKERKKAEELLMDITQTCQESNFTKYRVRLCEAWIEFCKTFGENEAIYVCYEHYYEIRKQMKTETNQKIATALANRQQLERQRAANRQLSEDNKELVQKSETDELTGISNRYGLNKKFVQASKLAQIKNQSVCMGLFDIDYFKGYNDRYGHLKGDVCLQSIARIVKKTAAEEYFVSRYGGDEFIVLGVGKTDEQIRQFANALFANVHDENMSYGAHPFSDRLTISMGFVNRLLPANYRISDLVREADEMLYQAKENGKNQWLMATL